MTQRARRSRRQRKRPNIRQVARDVERIKKGFLGEDNFKDTALSLTPGTTGTIQLLSGIAQGDDVTSRQGNKIKVKSLKFRINVIKGVATTDVIRLIIFKDMQQFGVVPTAVQLVEADGDPQAWIKKANRNRFTVLRDLTINLPSDDAGGPDMVQRNGFINFSSPPVINFIGTAATAASMAKGTFYIYVVANENTTKSTIIVATRMVFLDIS